jgi:hypothetical protein
MTDAELERRIAENRKEAEAMADAWRERRIAEIIAKLAELAVYSDEELAESAERMRRVAEDETGIYRRIRDGRAAGGSSG